MSSIPPDEVSAEADEIAADEAGRAHRSSPFARARRAWGRSGPGRRRLVAAGVVLTLLGVVVAVWWGLSSTVGKPYWRDLAYEVVDPTTTVVRFEVTRPSDMALVCTVEAQETGHAIVGRVDVPVPAGGPDGPDTVQVRATVRTTSLAVYGTARTCAPA